MWSLNPEHLSGTHLENHINDLKYENRIIEQEYQDLKDRADQFFSESFDSEEYSKLLTQLNDAKTSLYLSNEAIYDSLARLPLKKAIEGVLERYRAQNPDDVSASDDEDWNEDKPVPPPEPTVVQPILKEKPAFSMADLSGDMFLAAKSKLKPAVTNEQKPVSSDIITAKNLQEGIASLSPVEEQEKQKPKSDDIVNPENLAEGITKLKPIAANVQDQPNPPPKPKDGLLGILDGAFANKFSTSNQTSNDQDDDSGDWE